MDSPVPFESVSIESVLSSVERFSEQLNYVVSVKDIGASLNAADRLQTEAFTDSPQASFSLRGLCAWYVVVIIVCAPVTTIVSKCFIKRVKLVCVFHVL